MKYTELLESIKSQYPESKLVEVYKLISKASKDKEVAHTMQNLVKDSLKPSTPITHSMEDIEQIKQSLYEFEQKILEENGFKSQSPESYVKDIARQAFNFVSVKLKVRLDPNKEPIKDENGSIVFDSFFNSQTGIGTSSDPGVYNTSDIPIAISPQQATAYYANGGIPKIIIDKKVNGPFINGYKIDGDFTKKELDAFKKHYDQRGFLQALKFGLRDSLIFGGSAIIPHFSFDDNNALSYAKDIGMLGKLGQKQITRFWTADRWNLVLIPNVNIAAYDYFYPPYFYCPMAGLEICTQRMAIIRINQLPFWGALNYIGWGVPDPQSWMKSVLSYEVMINSIPIMGQQISLIYQHIPADPLIFSSGPDMFEQWAEANNQQLALWSLNSPKTFNSYGEIKALERTYTGYEELVMLLRQNIGAESTIPESSIFHTQSKGFSDNLEDVTLKQSESFKQISNIFEEQTKQLLYIMGLDFFGVAKKEKCSTLKLCLDSNTVITNEQKTSMGTNFFNMIKEGVDSGMPLDMAGKLASKFISGVDIDDDDIKLLKEAQEEADKKEDKDRKAQSQKGGLFGMGKPKTPGSAPTKGVKSVPKASASKGKK